MKRPLVIAHRGNSRHFPENTLPAFENVVASVTGFETDIQLSKDGIPVLYHDRTLEKLTGRRNKIYSQTLASLRKLDAGGWFSPSFKGAGILTLREFLTTFGNVKKLFLEIKARDDDPDRIIQDLTDKVVSEVRRQDLWRQVTILSFNADVLAQVYSVFDALACMQIFEKSLPVIETSLQAAPWLRGYVVEFNLLTEEFVKEAHRSSKTVMVFTCNSEAELSFAREVCVDAIISDTPDAAGQWLKGAS